MSRLFVLVHAVLVAPCLSVLIGCGSTEESSRGKLSGAMDKASDKNKGDRKVEPAEDPDKERDGSDAPAVAVAEGESQLVDTGAVNPMVPSGPHWFGISPGYALVGGNQFESLAGASVSYAFHESENEWIQVTGGIHLAKLRPGSALRSSIDGDGTVADLGVEYRYFTTPQNSSIANYLFGGVCVALLGWKYRNAITASGESGEEQISRDMVTGADLHVGTGFMVTPARGLRIAAEVIPGVMLWGEKTNEGFENDVFKAYVYLGVRLTVHFTIPGL